MPRLCFPTLKISWRKVSRATCCACRWNRLVAVCVVVAAALLSFARAVCLLIVPSLVTIFSGLDLPSLVARWRGVRRSCTSMLDV